MHNMDSLVEGYLKLRGAKAALTRELESKVAQIDERMEQIEQAFQAHMNQTGQTSFSTAHGQVYQTIKDMVNVGDWDAFYKWVHQKNRLDFLQKRVSSSALAAYVEETTDRPPGVSFLSERRVVVRNLKG